MWFRRPTRGTPHHVECSADQSVVCLCRFRHRSGSTFIEVEDGTRAAVTERQSEISRRVRSVRCRRRRALHRSRHRTDRYLG
ncbi:hypothetical protein AArcCO_2766 [Halalkaliarchaeum sp. AArc-CO]|nr:hypothetical protein AArcCO_2766 [Halalkaliarchaeum sp. AArc-CO]